MGRWLGVVLGGVVGAAALGLGQGAVTLRWAWEVEAARACSSNGGTLLVCQVAEGGTTSVSLSVSADPARAVHVAPVSVPPGWPTGSSSSGWGTVTTRYAFTPPPGSAGRRVEIVYRAWTDGVAALDLKLVVEIGASTSSCPSPPGGSPGTEARLPWRADRPITWDDFWASPPSDRDPQAAAGIAMIIEYELVPAVVREGAMWRARVGSLTATAAMERDRSWALPDRRTPAGLNHEQRHFDLAEAYRRLLEAALTGLSAVGQTASEASENLLALARSVFQEVMGRHSAAQAQYDRETNHGRDPARQEEWDARIAAWVRDRRPSLP